MFRSLLGPSARGRRRPVTTIAAALWSAAWLVALPAAAAPRYAAIVTAADTGEILYASNADAVLHPASITKIMTLYLAFEALETGRLHPTDRVVWSRHAAAQSPTKLGVPAGGSLSVDAVIRAIAVKSANDAAVALAERIDGTETAFAAHMTREAKRLGMTGTRFVNASGLPNAAHVTTARDIATLSAAMIRRFPERYRYFSTASFTYGKRRFVNHNHLLGKVAGVDGIKTGFTNDAGWTLAASAQRDGKRLIAVVLGARSPATRDKDVERLLDLGFDSLDHRALGEPFSIAANFHSLGAGGAAARPATGAGDEEPAVRPTARPAPHKPAPAKKKP
ncbi:MAG TPA: D-alanyl-D-alanine carboxypeptidase family protein [Sphingomonadaceae bacterium]|nr:D-alanyl-D-alanine carboxypeptidase family protein [Sphingomonadaceae bacterium]